MWLAHAASAQTITTVAGGGPPSGYPATSVAIEVSGTGNSLAYDRAGDLYIASPADGRIYKVTPQGALLIWAGNGAQCYGGDGIRATDACFASMSGIALDDRNGTIYVADSGNNRIRAIGPDGVITTVAGGAIPGYSGDGGLAVNARLRYPISVAVSGNGDLYIADIGNNVVRRVSQGIITTVAGNGLQGYNGDGIPATTASLVQPQALAIDAAGTLYIAETLGYRIRRVSGGVISTVAGNGALGISPDGSLASGTIGMPEALAVDASGILYFTDAHNQQVHRIEAGRLFTVAGTGVPGYSGDGGRATSAQLSLPVGIALDSAGGIAVADVNNHRVRRIAQRTITTVAGNGVEGFSQPVSATSATLHLPTAMAGDGAGNLYFVTYCQIHQMSGGVIRTIAGTDICAFYGDGGLASSTTINVPLSLAVDAAGTVFVGTPGRVQRISGGIITTVAGGAAMGFSGDGGPATSAAISLPRALAVDGAGNLYIADTNNYRVRKVANGVITTIAGNGTPGYSGDGGPAAAAVLGIIESLAVDGTGNLYLGDGTLGIVRKISGGVISRFAGKLVPPYQLDGAPATEAFLQGVNGLATDAAGNVYISEGGSSIIRKVTAGIINRVAGGYDAAFSGDGGMALFALLNAPRGLAIDRQNHLYIADAQNNRIRMVSGVAEIQYPRPGDTLPPEDILFTWGDSPGADQYWLDVGTSLGQGDVWGGATVATQKKLGALPCGDRTLYVQIWTHLDGTWQPPTRYTYHMTPNCPARIISPLAGSTLVGTVIFVWEAVPIVDSYWLDVGSSVGQGDLWAGAVTNTFQTVTEIPCDGRTLYVQLWTKMMGNWGHPVQYSYKAASDCQAWIASPPPRSTLTGTSVTFTWAAAAGAVSYWLDVGNSVAQGDISAGALTGTSKTVNGLPCDGRTIYVQLWTNFAGNWGTPQRYTYTAASHCGT